MLDRLLHGREKDPAVAARIPPGQYRTDKFPVLHYGSVPKTDLATWDFRVWGEVDAPHRLTWDEFKTLPRKTVDTDIHCVTRWSKLDTTWEGVPIQEVLSAAQVRPTATHVLSHCEQGYTANLPLEVLDDVPDGVPANAPVSFRPSTLHARISDVTQSSVPPSMNVITTMSHSGR